MTLQLGLENGLEQLITLQKLDTLALLYMEYHPEQLTEADVKVYTLTSLLPLTY
jgi:hypothetical protein